MKKILLVSNDFEFYLNLSAAIYRFNFRVIITQKSQDEIISEFELGARYDLYLFETKAKELNLKLIKRLRDSQNFTPIMLILDEAKPEIFKRIYYAKVNSFVVKPFLIEELLFHIFKSTNVLLGSKFELKNGIVFDTQSQSVIADNKTIALGKKESLFLQTLAKNSPHVVTFDEIYHNVYKGEAISQERIRSLVREIRKKIERIEILTIKGVGYKIE